MVESSNAWSGWKLVNPEKAKGGAEGRTYNRLLEKRGRQQGVLALIGKERPEILTGQQGVEISNSEVERWAALLSEDTSASVYEIRDRINFLASGLAKGRQELGWIVQPPAPIHLLTRESSPFTIATFSKLGKFREWQDAVESFIFSSSGMQKWVVDEHIDDAKAHTSWGMLIYIAMTRGAVLNLERLTALAQFSNTLCMSHGLAWVTFFESEDEAVAKKARHAPWRWVLGPEMLALLLRHIRTFGHPNCANQREAESFTFKSWRAFCKASKSNNFSLKAAMSALGTAFSFQLPAYVMGASTGRAVSTALSESRWRQLLAGKKSTDDSQPVNDESRSIVGKKRLALPIANVEVDLVRSAELLRDLSKVVYKARDKKRPTYKMLSKLLAEKEEETRSAAPIVYMLNLWLIELHKEKLKQSTLYRYLNAIGKPLFCAIGNSPISSDRALSLTSGYESVIDDAKSEKSKRYTSVVIARFHRFLVDNFDFPHLHIENGDSASVASTVDANLISELEYEHILAAIIRNGDAGLAQICHWIFVLGYRAGLRISEALSIEIRDVLAPATSWDGAEMCLLVRQNEYVDVKSYDSRRVLPLHLLLTPSEREEFRLFYLSRRELTKHTGVMLFSFGHDTTAPLLDSVVHEIIHDAMRAVTGDFSLRFHHLRHSFANNLLFAFHDVSPPWASPTHLRSLMESLEYKHTRTGLYFISQLIGHASPSVTLKSYVHCLELVKQDYLSIPASVENSAGARMSPEKQLSPFLPILGIKPTRLRQWKRRFGNDYTAWMRRAFSDVEVDAIDDATYLSYGDVKLNMPILRTLDMLDLAELETLIVAQEKTAEELETIFRLKAGSYLCLKKAYTQLLLSPTKLKSSDFRHSRPSVYSEDKKLAFQNHDVEGIVLSPPRSAGDKAIASKIFKRIAQSRKSDIQSKAMREQLLFFHKNHRAREGHIYIPDETAGLEFIKWLCSLDRDIKVILNLRASENSEHSSDEQLAYWVRGLSSCATSTKINLVGTGSRKTQAYGTATLKIHSIAKRSGRSSSWKYTNKPAESWPVRYALFMGCVLMSGLKCYQDNCR